MEIYHYPVAAAQVECFSQQGPSDCGSCAIKNVVKILEGRLLSEEEYDSIPVRSRDYGTRDLLTYLKSRSVAGLDSNDIVNGLRRLSPSSRAVFFSSSSLLSYCQEHEIPTAASFVRHWMSLGAVCVATGSCRDWTFFHHQTIFGVSRDDSIWLTNPMESMTSEEFQDYVTFPSVLQIANSKVRSYFWPVEEGSKSVEEFLQGWEWGNETDVVGQLGTFFENESLRQSLKIPWAGSTGVIVVVEEDNEAARAKLDALDLV